MAGVPSDFTYHVVLEKAVQPMAFSDFISRPKQTWKLEPNKTSIYS